MRSTICERDCLFLSRKKINRMKPLDIIKKYYPESSDAYRILVTHSRSVADKALALARLHPEMNLDLTFIEEAAFCVTLQISIAMGRPIISVMAIWEPI